MVNTTDIIALVRSTSDHVVSELTALDEEGAAFHPAEGEWCAKEVVGHVIEADRRGFWGRIRSILAGEAIVAWDQSGVAASRGDCARPLREILDEFDRTRAEGLEVVAALTEADLEAAGVHPDIGVVTASEILHEWPYHDRDHLKQILENTRALLWPDMGATQRFSEID